MTIHAESCRGEYEQIDETYPGIQVRLLPGEEITYIKQLDITKPDIQPSALQALMRLTNVERPADIGSKGPSIAALSTEANLDTPELRKYEVVFGRDTLRVAIDSSEQFPELLKTTVITLAALQGSRDEPASEQEPGKIIHEHRDPSDPIANECTKKEGWQWPYYGSIDSTPMFISAVTKLVQHYGPQALDDQFEHKDGGERSIGEALAYAMSWLENKLESNPEGLLEFKMRRGLLNQAWKDSRDSYMHAGGNMANHDQGIASIEVQALAYDALLDAAKLYTEEGSVSLANRLVGRADNLRQVINDTFWIEERGGYFALATDRDADGNTRPLKVKSSNMGHILNSNLLNDDTYANFTKKQALIRSLFAPDMLAPHGIRTLSSREHRYRPGAYHNGSVWLWDSLYTAQGLHRHGYHGLAMELKKRAMKAIDGTNCLPEYVRGDAVSGKVCNENVIEVHDRILRFSHTLEQPSQEIQAWTVAGMLKAKYQYQPLYPEKSLPLRAQNDKQWQFEEEILTSLINS